METTTITSYLPGIFTHSRLSGGWLPPALDGRSRRRRRMDPTTDDSLPLTYGGWALSFLSKEVAFVFSFRWLRRGNKRKCQAVLWGSPVPGGWKVTERKKSYLRFMSPRIITVNCHSNSRRFVAVCLSISRPVDPLYSNFILLWNGGWQSISCWWGVKWAGGCRREEKTTQMKRLFGLGGLRIKQWHRSLITWKHLLILLRGQDAYPLSFFSNNECDRKTIMGLFFPILFNRMLLLYVCMCLVVFHPLA